MFFQGLITLTGVLLFFWLAWKWVVIPILKEKGIVIDELKTDYTEKLESLKREYTKMETSARAAEEGVKILDQIKELEKKIEDANERMNR